MPLYKYILSIICVSAYSYAAYQSVFGMDVVSHKDFVAIAAVQQSANESNALRITGHVHLLPQLIVWGLDPKQIVLAVAAQLSKFKESFCVIKCPCREMVYCNVKYVVESLSFTPPPPPPIKAKR